MEHCIADIEYPGNTAEVIEKMREYLSKSGMGVTIIGNRVTVRFYLNKELVDVGMIIERVDDDLPEEEDDENK